MENRQKLFYSMFMVIIMITVNGCGDRTQIEDRDFVLAAGVSYDNDMYKISFARPDLSVMTGQNAPENENFVVTYGGNSLYSIERQYKSNSDKMLDFSHMKAFILDYKIVSNKDKMKEFLQYVQNNYKISRNTLLFYTDSEEEEILNLNDNVSGNIGEYLEQIYNNNVGEMYKDKTTIGDCIQLLYEKDKVEIIPRVIIKDDKVAISGAGLFQNGVILKALTESELESVCLTKGTGKNYNISLDKDVILKVKNIKKIFHYTIKEGMPFVLIEITGKSDIIQNPDEELTAKIKYKVDTTIENMIRDNLNNIMKKEKIDFLNLYRISAYKKKNIWIHYKDRQEEFIENLDFRVTANIDIMNEKKPK